MVRWSMALATALGVLTIAIVAILWIGQTIDIAAEELRRTRVAHQQLQQQHSVLNSSDSAQQIEQLNQAMDALQISLVEAVSDMPVPDGVIDVAFEQQLMPPMAGAGKHYPVSVLRLSLMLTIEHSVGLVNMLDRVSRATSFWPSEVRGCELQRLPLQRLSAQCVMDFYHWSDDSAVTRPDNSLLNNDQDEGT